MQSKTNTLQAAPGDNAARSQAAPAAASGLAPVPAASAADCAHLDLENDRLASAWWTRPVEVLAEFATAPGRIGTLEGVVHYRAGAALLTGSDGERWPVEREDFERRYEALAPGPAAGAPGRCRKRVSRVLARQMTQPFTTRAGALGDTLTGQARDWLLQYAPGQHGVVAERIFGALYQPGPPPPAPAPVPLTLPAPVRLPPSASSTADNAPG